MVTLVPGMRQVSFSPEAGSTMHDISRAIRRAALACCLLLAAASSDAQTPVRNVLILQSFGPGNIALDAFTGHFRVELDTLAGTSVNVVQIVLEQARLPEPAVVDYIRATFANRPAPDLIVTVAAPAALFARRHRQQLFPGAPLLLTAVDQRFLRAAPLADDEASAAVANNVPHLMEEVLHLLPRTRQVLMIIGPGELGKGWRQTLGEELQGLADRLTFIWSEDRSLPELLRRGATLPPDSAIFYLTFGTDAQGLAYADDRVLEQLRATANAPMFGLHSIMLGTGIVGGELMSIETLGRNAAGAADRILNGAPPRSATVPVQSPGGPSFDWRELQRWGIDDSRLPAGSVVLFQEPSLWSEHRVAVLTLLGGLAVQSLLIGGLLYQRRARQRAESESRRNLALATDANRRQTMSALTSSIAHDLGQPLSSMIHNAQALEMMIAADRATPDSIREVVSDIRSQGIQATQIIERHRAMLRTHQVEVKEIELHTVISESLALVAHDLRARQIRTAVNLPSARCIVTGDQVLLQQVFVNLLVNAIDAMAEVAPARRHLTIGASVGATDVELSVRDSGPGLPDHMAASLFAPFVTSKPHGVGIGLAIVRTIVDLHGGTLRARNNPDGGATFTVTLHRSDARTPTRRQGAV
jgi:signal transduction histidine kinase